MFLRKETKMRLTSNAGFASATAALALTLAAAASPAQAQYATFAQQCRTLNGPAQVDSCLNALRYEPGNPELMTRLGDGMLAANRPGGAFDAYSEALAVRPDYTPARQGRDEAYRQIASRAGSAPVAYQAVPAQPQTVYVPVQQVIIPQPTAQPVAVNPFDGRWSGHIEPRGQKFAVAATVVGGHLRIFYEDSTDRVTLEGPVDASGYFQGKGFLKDKNKSSGDGGDTLAISGRFTQNGFEGTGSAGVKATTMRLNRDG